MNTEDIKSLLDRYIAGQCTEKEKALLETWYNNDREKFLLELTEEEIDSDLQLILEQLPAPAIKEVVPLWKRLTVAAAAVAAITLGTWLYPTLSSRPDAGGILRDLNHNAIQNNIAPGRNTATLTLANGKVITLDTNKNSVVVTDSVKTTTMLTASTPRGGTYQVVLPDGSKVWLNADSRISFPSQFVGKTRKIQLTGEAYLEVAKDKAHPFIVESAGQEVTVLGTHFNINAYPDQASTKTTLLEGSVSISSLRGTALSSRGTAKDLGPTGPGTTILHPGQQSVLAASNRIMVEDVNVQAAVAWKNGNFMFNAEDIRSVMKQLERWYDIEVVYEGQVTGELYYGDISRFKNISQVLTLLEQSQGVHFKIEGRRVTVKE